MVLWDTKSVEQWPPFMNSFIETYEKRLLCWFPTAQHFAFLKNQQTIASDNMPSGAQNETLKGWNSARQKLSETKSFLYVAFQMESK